MLGCFAITATFVLSFCPVLHCTSISNLIITKTTNIRQSKGLASSFSRGEVQNTLSSLTLTAWIIHLYLHVIGTISIIQSTQTFWPGAFQKSPWRCYGLGRLGWDSPGYCKPGYWLQLATGLVSNYHIIIPQPFTCNNNLQANIHSAFDYI